MQLAMNSDNARALATTYGQRADEALRIAKVLTTYLERGVMDDTYDVAGALNAMSEELDTGDVVLRHQADVMDGLTVDVDALSQDLGVQAWKVNKQLERLDRGDITAGELLISLVDFGQTEITGLDTTVRDFVPDAPPPGEDAEFDALVQRLDGWLLQSVVDGRAIADAQLLPARQADIEALAARMGMPDLASITVVRQFRVDRFPHDREDDRTKSVNRTVPLPTSEYWSWTFDWVTKTLGDQRKVSRAVDLPTIGELFDLSTYVHHKREKINGGDNDEYDFYSLRDRDPQAIIEEAARLDQEWADLAWLPAVLAGTAAPPATLASDPALAARVIAFARKFGYGVTLDDHDRGRHDELIEGVDYNRPDFAPTGGADVGGSAGAIDFLKANGVLANALESPRPIQKARLPVTADGLAASVELGRQQGVITDDVETNVTAIGLYLSGLDPKTDVDTIDPVELEAEAPDLRMDELVGLIATAIPPHQLPENRLIQAVTYIGRAKTVGERIEAIEQAILGLKSVATVGEPARTQRDWIDTLPDEIVRGGFKAPIEGEEFNWLLDHIGVPGYHESRDWRRGKGKRKFHLVNGANGAVDDFVVEVVPKGQPLWSQIVFAVAKVAISIVAPPLGVAIALMDAAIAAKDGNWTGAAIAAVGALAAGAAAWASTAASTASTATNSAVAAADAVAKGTGSLQALNSANQAFIAANSTASLANTAANAAQFVNAGVRAGVAFADGDIVGGIVNSVTSVGAGASGFGYGAVGQALATGGRAIQAVDTAVDAIEGDDIAGAVAGGLAAGATLVDLASQTGVASGDLDATTVTDLGRISESARDVADVATAGGAIARGIEEEQWASLVGGGLRFGSSALHAVGNADGVVAGQVFDRNDAEGFDQVTDDLATYGTWAAGAADLADGGLALAEGDYLGGTTLLSSGTSGLLRGNGIESTNVERLESIASIADKVATAGPGLDHSQMMNLLGTDMQALVDSFEGPAPGFQSTGDVEQDLAAARSERQAAQAGLDTLDHLLAFDTGGAVAGLLGGARSRMVGELADLRQQEQEVAIAYRAEMSSRRAAELELRARRQRQRPELRPSPPSHLPLARPDDLVPPGSQVVVETVDGPRWMVADADGELVPIELAADRGIRVAPTGGGELTPEQQDALVGLARLEEVGAVEDRMFGLMEQLDGLEGEARGRALGQIDQLGKRREGLLLMASQNARPEDFAQFDGTRFVVDGNLDATSYYYFGSEHDTSDGSGPRTPVVLGPGTRQRLLDSPAFKNALYKIVHGSTSQPGGGQIALDLEGFTEDFHIGDTQLEYHTTRTDDGQLTTTFTFSPGDGIQDPATEVFLGPTAPIGAIFEDGLGPAAELGGRPFLYEPFTWQVTYPDHGHELRAGERLLGPLPPKPGQPRPGTTIDPRSLSAPAAELRIPPRPGATADPGSAGPSIELTIPPRPGARDLAEALAGPAQPPTAGPGDVTPLVLGLGAGILAGTPALKGTPYHPEAVIDRVRPPYDPVHERPGYRSNFDKSPEPPDARRVYESGRLVRTDTETWFGRSEDGKRFYRFRSSQSGEDGVRRAHWNGDFEPGHRNLPRDVKRAPASSFLRAAGGIARVLGPIGYVPMFLDFKDLVDQAGQAPPDA